MHAVEALLAAADATGDIGLRERALGIARRVVHWTSPGRSAGGSRSTSTRDWRPQLEHNGDRPDDPFQPYGATVGHGLEWSRLLLHLEASLGDERTGLAARVVDRRCSIGRRPTAGRSTAPTASSTPPTGRAGRWSATGCTGCSPKASLRPPPCASGPASSGTPSWPETWWAYAERHLIDRERGSWHHQLDAENRVIGTVWPGKPDLYHAVQATLIPRLPLAPSLAAALAAGPPAL